VSKFQKRHSDKATVHFFIYRHPMSGKRRKKNLPARIVEQAGVPKDRVIELSRKRILIAHAWSMLFHLLSREGIFLLPTFSTTSAQGLLIYDHLNRPLTEV